MCQLIGIRSAAGGAGGTCRPARKPRTAKPTVGGGGDLRVAREHSGEDRPEEDRDIGPGFHQPGPAEHFVLAQVLRQDRVFDRPEEGRMDAHREHRGEHQRDVGEHEPGAAEDHDPDLGELDDPDQPRLVVIVGELARQCREQEEGQDEQRLRDRAELELLRRVR